MAYIFYLDKLQLPVTPSKLQIKIENKNSTVILINEGEVNILKKPGLSEISFDALIPQIQYPFASAFNKASTYLNKLEELKISQKPFQFIVSRIVPSGEYGFCTNIRVGLEDYTISEDAKEGFDLTISIKLKQYKSYGTKTVKIVTNGSTTTASVQQERSSESVEQKKTYTVVAGDCLWNIAKKYLGNGMRYLEIYNLNKDKIKNPDLIYVGQVLTLPS